MSGMTNPVHMQLQLCCVQAGIPMFDRRFHSMGIEGPWEKHVRCYRAYWPKLMARAAILGLVSVPFVRT